jgi:hypothetical protein
LIELIPPIKSRIGNIHIKRGAHFVYGSAAAKFFDLCGYLSQHTHDIKLFSPQRREGLRDVFSYSLPLILQNTGGQEGRQRIKEHFF